MRVALIVLSAGLGKRLGLKKKKPFVFLKSKPLLIHTLTRLSKNYPFCALYVTYSQGDRKRMQSLLVKYGFNDAFLIKGGATRAASLFCVLKKIIIPLKIKMQIDKKIIHLSFFPNSILLSLFLN